MKYLKSILMIASLFISSLFYISGCKSDVNNNSNTPEAFSNPYNYIGAEHNSGLEYGFNYLQELKKEGRLTNYSKEELTIEITSKYIKQSTNYSIDKGKIMEAALFLKNTIESNFI